MMQQHPPLRRSRSRAAEGWSPTNSRLNVERTAAHAAVLLHLRAAGGAADYCDRCLDGVVVFVRMSPHGSADFFLSGTFSIVDLYASSTAFRFACSSAVSGGLSGARFIPGMNWAEAAPVNAAMIALAPLSNLINSRRLISLSCSSGCGIVPAQPGILKGDPAKRAPLLLRQATFALRDAVKSCIRALRSPNDKEHHLTEQPTMPALVSKHNLGTM